jgi:hypothetical protein
MQRIQPNIERTKDLGLEIAKEKARDAYNVIKKEDWRLTNYAKEDGIIVREFKKLVFANFTDILQCKFVITCINFPKWKRVYKLKHAFYTKEMSAITLYAILRGFEYTEVTCKLSDSDSHNIQSC